MEPVLLDQCNTAHSEPMAVTPCTSTCLEKLTAAQCPTGPCAHNQGVSDTADSPCSSILFANGGTLFPLKADLLEMSPVLRTFSNAPTVLCNWGFSVFWLRSSVACNLGACQTQNSSTAPPCSHERGNHYQLILAFCYMSHVASESFAEPSSSD